MNGANRIHLDFTTPPHVAELLDQIARDEKRTISSVIDEIVCDAFGVDYRNGKLRSVERNMEREMKNVLQMFPQEFRDSFKRR